MKSPALLANARQHLFAAFANRLQTDWQKKYAPFGDHWQNNRFNTKFHDAIAHEIRSDQRVKFEVSAATIGRALREGGFAKRPQRKTLDALSQYLGYADWAAFVSTHPSTAPAPTPAAASPPGAVDPAPAARPVGEHPSAPISTYMIALAAVLFTFWAIYRAMACGVARQTTDRIEQALFAKIDAANAFEFDLYRAVPHADTTDLSRYFDPAGTAYIEIADRARRLNERGGYLNVPPSAYAMLPGRQVMGSTANTAHVRTREDWHLVWYFADDPDGGVKYDEVNQQDYYLKLGADRVWRIVSNQYEGEIQPINRPVYPPEEGAPERD